MHSSSVCGTRYTETNKNYWPWHAAIYRVIEQEEAKYGCGGTLITSKLVLTVAHYMCKRRTNEPRNPDEFLVFLGRKNLNIYDPTIQLFHVICRRNIFFFDFSILSSLSTRRSLI